MRIERKCLDIQAYITCQGEKMDSGRHTMIYMFCAGARSLPEFYFMERSNGSIYAESYVDISEYQNYLNTLNSSDSQSIVIQKNHKGELTSWLTARFYRLDAEELDEIWVLEKLDDEK